MDEDSDDDIDEDADVDIGEDADDDIDEDENEPLLSFLSHLPWSLCDLPVN